MKSIRSIILRFESFYHRWSKPLYMMGVLIGGILLIYQAIKGFRALQVFDFSAELSPMPILLGLLILMFTVFQQVVAWFFVMKGLGFQQPFLELLSGYLVSFLPRYIPGVFWGYLSRNAWLAERYRVNLKLSSLGSMIELLIGFIAIFFVLGVSFAFRYGAIVRFLLCLVMVFIVWFSWWFFNRSRIWSKILQGLLNPKENESYSISFFFWCCAVGILALNMVFNGAVVLLVGRTLAFTTVNLTLENVLAFTSYFCLAYLVGFFVFFLPAGLGLREISLSYLLSQATGMLPDVASALSVIDRLLIVMAEISWLVVILIIKAVDANWLNRFSQIVHRKH